MTTLTQREKERLQSQLLAIHARIPEQQALDLQANAQFRRSLPGWFEPEQPPLPGLEEWVR